MPDKITELDQQLSAVGQLELVIEKYNETREHLPSGYDFYIKVPLENANKIKRYFSDRYPFVIDCMDFMPGDIFYFKGVKCFAVR